MAWQFRFLPVLAAATFALAADEQANSTKPDGSHAPAQSQTDSRRPHIHFGGFMVNAGYSRFGGYPWGYAGYPYYSTYDYYSPFGMLPLAAAGYYGGFAYQPWMGDVKIASPSRTAWVYLDGALAGRADKLKDIWLDPGTYTLELRDNDQVLSQRIYVLSGKTLEITAEMMAKSEAQP